MRLKSLIAAIVLGSALAAGIFVATRLQTPASLTTAFLLPTPTSLPDFSLVDQEANTVTRDTFRNHWNLVFFGFTHCPDICPTTLQVLALAKTELAAAGQQPLPRIVLVSVDPERDSPDVIGRYVDHFGVGNLGVTGQLEELRKLTSGLGIYFEKQAGDENNYAVDHSAAVLVINPQGEFHALFSGPHEVQNFVHDVPLLMAGR